jgi:spermidine synthase
VGDGRDHLRTSRGGFDLIFSDAYTGAGIPEDLSDESFFTLMRSRLDEHGIAVLNLSVEADEEERLRKNFREVFGQVDCYRTRDDANLLLIARADQVLPKESTIRSKAGTLQRTRYLPFDLLEIVDRLGVACVSSRP